jgi:ligand-binding sensor domain-containing protein
VGSDTWTRLIPIHRRRDARAAVVLRTYSKEDGLGNHWVNQLFETSDHRFWVATDTGVAEFFPEAGKGEPNFKTYTQANGLLYYGINALNEDAGDNLWLASNVGAMKLASQGFISTSEQDGVLSVSAIFGDNAGDVCFRASLFGDAGTHRVRRRRSRTCCIPRETTYARFGCFDGKQFTWLKPDVLTNDQLGWVGEMVTLQARNGEWWFGTGAGLYRFPAFDKPG